MDWFIDFWVWVAGDDNSEPKPTPEGILGTRG
jgi:hypothetical protein